MILSDALTTELLETGQNTTLGAGNSFIDYPLHVDDYVDAITRDGSRKSRKRGPKKLMMLFYIILGAFVTKR